MTSSFRPRMASLHTWTGLLPGWLLFVIFLFGTTAFFQDEITRWMQPELSGRPATSVALDAAARYLHDRAPDAESWSLALPSQRGGGPLSVSWESASPGAAALDPGTGHAVDLRATRGGDFLYRVHFDLYYIPYWLARDLVSLAALAMLTAILSGTVTHKKIFADFFLLRLGKGQRSWLDAHNVTAVLALPFHLMMTYTGLVTLLFTLMPWAISANFPSEDAFYAAAYPQTPQTDASGEAAPMLPLGMLAARAQAIWQGDAPLYITVRHPGDAAAEVEITPARTRLGADRPTLVLSGVTGKLLAAAPPGGGAAATQQVMVDLHSGVFAGPALRWLYFLSGAGGTVMVATGLVLWTVKRRQKLPDPAHPHFGFRLVERLNIGVIAGAPAGIAVYFLANRLLPPGLGHRADWEINSLFVAWGAVFAWTAARPARRAWIEALAGCAALYLLVPLVSAMTTRRGLVQSLMARDWVFAGFDGVMVLTAAGFAFAAWKTATHKSRVRDSVRRGAARQPAQAQL